MRAAVQALLLVFVFTIPWEYSLDFGVPFGNVARLAGALLLLVAVLAVLLAGRLYARGPLLGLTLALFVWQCATYFWSIEPEITLSRLPGYLQEMMIVWLVAEFAGSPRGLRAVLRAWLAGSWLLVALTAATFIASTSATQIRFAAEGQDPNDMARFLCLGLPVAALLADREPNRWGRILSLLYLPAGLAAVLLTASRGGLFEALTALAGCGLLLWRRQRPVVYGAIFALPVAAFAAWELLPAGTIARLGTIADQAQGGDLNQRVNIWEAGWRAFQQTPFIGHGAGSFVSAAGLAPIDTAHNTILSILVEDGLIGFVFGLAIVVAAIGMALALRGTLRIALLTVTTVWIVASMVGTTGESRTTWLLFAVVALAYQLHSSRPGTQDASSHVSAALSRQAEA